MMLPPGFPPHAGGMPPPPHMMPPHLSGMMPPRPMLQPGMYGMHQHPPPPAYMPPQPQPGAPPPGAQPPAPANGAPAAAPAAAPAGGGTELVWDDEEMSMEERRASLPKYAARLSASVGGSGPAAAAPPVAGP
jgi:hypothetical protein